MIKIKVCGITNIADALAAALAGADLLGFVFYRSSKRYVDPATAGKIASMMPPYIARVGVFVDEDPAEVRRIAELAKLDILQFHGNESPEYCKSFKPDYKVVKAFRLQSKDDLAAVSRYRCDYFLFDTYISNVQGGTGETFDWKILQNATVPGPIFLSGGLSDMNVAKAIAIVDPYGVDVSSGVEASPGKKDPAKLKHFVANVRKAI